jgi:hypothetical protein
LTRLLRAAEAILGRKGLLKALYFLALFFFALPIPVCACMCAPEIVAEAWDRADLVFSGVVLKVAAVDLAAIESSEGRMVEVSFDVNHVWKGPGDSSIHLQTSGDAASCGYRFSVGEHYLVYAQSTETGFRTSQCTRTRPLSEAQTDLALLPDAIFAFGELGVVVKRADKIADEALHELEFGNSSVAYRKLPDLIDFHENLIPSLIRLAKGSSSLAVERQRLAVKALGSYGYFSRPAIPVLLDLLCIDDLYLRAETSYALQNIFPESYHANPEFFNSLNATPNPDCESFVSDLRSLEISPMPPDSLRALGGKTGPTYFIKRRKD